MSVAVSTVTTKLGAPSRSIGDIKMEIHDLAIISGDVSATATASQLSRIDYAILVSSVVQTAVPTYSGKVATFTFTDPVASVKGQVIIFGR